jgi:predicted tellurium resistance membrane protein TerC
MSKKRLYLWLGFIAIVLLLSIGIKFLQQFDPTYLEDPKETISKVVYAVLLLSGYYFMVIKPKIKDAKKEN